MKVNDESNDNKEKNEFEEESSPDMILTIDIGNNQLKKLNIYDIDNTEQDIYNFCLNNKLDFNILKEIKRQIQILIANRQLQNSQLNKLTDASKELSQTNLKSSDNLTETNFNTNHQNNNEDLNNIESFDRNSKKTTNLEKYYNKLAKDDVNNNTYNTNNKMQDNGKVIRNKIHKPKIKSMEQDIDYFNTNMNNNITPSIFNTNYTPENSSLYIYPSFVNKNPNLALRNYFSKEEDNYFPEENPYSGQNIKTNNNISDYNNYIKRNKKNKKVSKSMSLNGIYLKNYNPGKDLYERNLKYNEEKKKKLNILKKNLEIDENEDNTFSPKINKISKIQIENRKQKKLEYSNPDIIKNYKKYRDDKIKTLKQRQERELEQKCTFKPKINHSSSTSKNISVNNYKLKKFGSRLDIKNISCFNSSINDKKNKSNNSSQNKNNCINKNKLIKEYNSNINNINGCSKSINRFEKLYNERNNQKDNQNKLRQKIYNELSFKPQINEKSEYMKLDKPFKERLKIYSNKSKENLTKIKKIYEKEKGFEESFKPQINSQKSKGLFRINENASKQSINNKNIKNTKNNINIIHSNKNNKLSNKSYSNSSINFTNNYKNKKKKIDCYTKLYLYNQKYQNEKNLLTEKYYQSQNKSPLFCPSSEEIINKKLEKYYKKIFHILDSDEDNKITSSHINIFALPKKLQKILRPIFVSLEEEDESLNELEFIYVCKQLYGTVLSWIDKRELMILVEQDKKDFKKKNINDKNIHSYKPKINKRNNSYEKMAIDITGGQSSHLVGKRTERCKDNYYINYTDLKGSVDLAKKGIMLNNFFFVNSSNNKNKIEANDITLKNKTLNRNINSSVIWTKNKSSLLNNHAKNSLINSTSNSYKGHKLNNYFNIRNNIIYSKGIKNNKFSS